MVTAGGALSMVVALVFIAGLLTYKKRWGWLYKNWLTTTDPKRIGVMYIIVALVMLLRGAADAGMMRVQQATSVGAHHGFLNSDHFQQIFSAHGTIMIFIVAMGLMFGLINLVVPLQIGSRDVAFPFLNATSFWLVWAACCPALISL
jgi:cytochrome o ubiquinol oxidase subunit 1